ncbi:MAG TPA: hypothetical protein VK496_05100, partial [Gaiellaceae bacterium]|nr:hypothetical protein [Gaiellaceae bacterium]
LAGRIETAYPRPYTTRPMHEFVATAGPLEKRTGVRATDVAKRLIDLGFHPSTVYFPLVVDEALMIEPTETETKETLDGFADAMLEIAREAAGQAELLKEAPHVRPVKRLDEVRAAKQPVVRYRFEQHEDPAGTGEPRQLEAQKGA